tara:strand:+ start:615 stop:815 length:201 start_codon:yes stop_codon:yes gene_type:complete
MKSINLKINGMHCKSCAMVITDILEDLQVKSKINHETGTAEISFDENKVSLEEIKKLIQKEGFTIK